MSPVTPVAAPLPISDGGAVSTLSRHGRSFHFASKLLDPQTAMRSARLYRFCRYVDDIADSTNDHGLARQRLDQISAMLTRGVASDPVIGDFLLLARECEIEIEPALELVRGVRSDLELVRFADPDELLQYCYRVAGTVGLMMCAVLEVRNPKAYPFAIDLGIAMQLTNIARDVAEDALQGRRYLPASMLGDVEPSEIVDPDPDLQLHLAASVDALLNLAERFYVSGQRGLVYLPDRARLGIRVAARVYRRIGMRIRRNDCATWRGRAIVPGWQKVLVAITAVATEYLSRPFMRARRHDRLLHHSLRGRFGSSQSLHLVRPGKAHE